MFLALTFAVAALQSPLPACRPVPARPTRSVPGRPARASPAGALSAPAVPADDLYSARARRRLASLLRLRLLELRKQGLERVTQTIERELGNATALPPR